MKIYYKLTDQNLKTYNGFQWVMGEWQKAIGDISQGLCSNAWLHCYDSPLLAILHNPIYGNIKNPRLFEVEVDGKMKDGKGIKRGFRRMRLLKEIPLPTITTTQRRAYGILCAREVYKKKMWNEWADNWLNGKNRYDNAAAYAAAYAYADVADIDNAAAYADVADIDNAAAYAAAYAAYTADVAADVAAAAYAAYTADVAAAYAAAYAAADVAADDKQLDLPKIAEQAIKEF